MLRFRILWTLATLLIVSLGAFLIGSYWDDFTNSPTYVSWENSNAPIAGVDFPGVAICDVNKLSKVKVIAFVEEV